MHPASLLAFLLALTLFLPALADTPSSSELPTTDTTAEMQDETSSDPQPARGYILLYYSGGTYWLPLPEEEDYTLPIIQTRPDGTEEVNLIHVTPEGFYMESSTCENQDCVDQGYVTLDNRHERILAGMVICLPNQVSLELYTPEEILEMYAQDSTEEE